jgi:cytoskeletal protein CcmA (bactofilin family)
MKTSLLNSNKFSAHGGTLVRGFLLAGLLCALASSLRAQDTLIPNFVSSGNNTLGGNTSVPSDATLTINGSTTLNGLSTFNGNTTLGNVTISNGSIISGNAVFEAAPAGNLAGFVFSINPNVTNVNLNPLGVPYVAAFVDTDASSGGIANFAFGHSGGTISLYRSEGTAESPTAIQSGHTEGGVYAGGYDGSQWAVGAFINFAAQEAWTSGNHGSYMYIETTPKGTTAPTQIGQINNDGSFGFQNYAGNLNYVVNNVIYAFYPTVNQNGSGYYTGFLINAKETSTGSGPNLLLDLQTNNVSQFNVSDTGGVTARGNVTISGAETVSGNATVGGNLSVSGNVNMATAQGDIPMGQFGN